MERDASYYINHLGLEPHPEGGYFKSTHTSQESIDAFGTTRKLFTSIYFLLGENDVSHFHRLKSDELWYFHGGSPLIIHVIDEKGEYYEHKLGLNIEKGESPQVIVPKNSIFGSSVVHNGAFSLVGCMVSPGFDFDDFELFTQSELLEKYPEHKQVITKMAYEILPE
ncbi:cupin domain-containing protein [Psychrobacillus vulpis]|uniref:Cupin domain-containing protein n=1 Tax=Psychrobacillus vulpis TaxID=2325572 RepID=A0A544TVY0_9BACI|nr:cupin domain-containing protein [Psychrobacillus vulpis]TQR21584.1 cupin domain-containing protein [Psychrobacillus vulpis]